MDVDKLRELIADVDGRKDVLIWIDEACFPLIDISIEDHEVILCSDKDGDCYE